MAFVMNGHNCIVLLTLFSFFTPVYIILVTGFFSGIQTLTSFRAKGRKTGMLEHDIRFVRS